ncbi:MAG TPA: GAF domain-containing SpoIIE family protein phosphatase, partial [Solirubrobacteraceae bacterium]
ELVAMGAAITDTTERRRAEAARERLQLATAAFAAAATVRDVAHATVAEARQAFESESAALLVLEGERLELRAFAALSEEYQKRMAMVPLHEQRPITVAARTGQAVIVRNAAEMAERFPVLAGAVPAVAVVPMIASGTTVGVLMIDFERPRELDAGERDLLDALAGQSAVALARAQLYEREHTVAQTLQASLLPRVLPQIPGLDIAARLEAGAPGLDVGGDFYDAFALGEDAWGVAIGDVCGKGVEAAALTALARHTVRAAARTEASPAAVLEALNRAALAESKPGQFLTAVYARLVARPEGGFAVALACGGHPPPVVLDAALSRRDLACSGTLLGAVADPEIVDSRFALDPGDTMLLYTDGLTEAGAPEGTLDTDDVADLLAAARGATAAQTAEGCLDRALATAGGVARDDVAVLVAQVAPREPALSTAGRNRARESSTAGQ